MKILITGFTSRMVNSQKLKNNYLTCEPLLAQILREQLGNEVDHRAVSPGEDLHQYDLAILGICGIQSKPAAYAAGTAWAFETVKNRLLFCGDWSIENTGQDLKNALCNWERCKRSFQTLGRKYTPDDERRIHAMLTSIMTEPLPLLAPFFPWGNHNLILANNLPKTSLYAWDPSPFVRLPELKAPTERKAQWVYAALQDCGKDWLTKQQKMLKWPVVVHDKNNPVPEERLLEEYAGSCGVLASPYKNAGSGWWRARYIHAAHVGAIMICDYRDSAVMSAPSYRYSAIEVEHMSPESRANLAQRQRDWFYGHIATREKTLSDLTAALLAAVETVPAMAAA